MVIELIPVSEMLREVFDLSNNEAAPQKRWNQSRIDAGVYIRQADHN